MDKTTDKTTNDVKGGVTKGIPSKPRYEKSAPNSKKQVFLVTDRERKSLSARVDEILAIESRYAFVGHAKTQAIRLVDEMPNPLNVPARINRTTNHFPVFLGRLNPPHKFHLISLITAILIARTKGTKALFLFGNGGGPNPDNPLTFTTKRDFIINKLGMFGFVYNVDYNIEEQSAHFISIIAFVKREYNNIYGPVTLFHIGGDKPELRKSTLTLDVDKLPMPTKFTVTESGTNVPITCVKVIIPSQSTPRSDVMSASLVRKTACEHVRGPSPETAFTTWQERFTPMYDDEYSRPVFNEIIRVSCGVELPPPQGGSRRKRTRKHLKTFRSKRTIRNRRRRYTRRRRM